MPIDRRCVVRGLLLRVSLLAGGAPALASTGGCAGLQAAWLSPTPGQSPVVAFPPQVLPVAARAIGGRAAAGALTVSIGVAVLRDGDYVSALIERADPAMHAAKACGRNRIATGATAV